MKWRTISVWTPSLPAMRTQRHLLFCFYSQIKMTPIFSAFFLCFYYYYSPDVCFSFSFFKVSLAHFLYYLLQFTRVYSGGLSFPVSNTTWKKKINYSCRIFNSIHNYIVLYNILYIPIIVYPPFWLFLGYRFSKNSKNLTI